MQRTRFGEMTCSIARTFDIAGEPWSPLILRDVWRGLRRFDEIQTDLQISRKVLAERLKWLTAHGILEPRPYSERPPRNEYRLTEKGSELCDVLLAVIAWGTAGRPERPGRRSSFVTAAVESSPTARCAAHSAANRSTPAKSTSSQDQASTDKLRPDHAAELREQARA